MTKQKLARFEFPQDVVVYLRNAVNTQQLRGADQAQTLIYVLGLLNSPINKAELVDIAPPEPPKKEEPKK